MARELEFNMTLGASLTSGFRGSMTAAQARIRGLGQAVRAMESSDTGKLGARLDAQRNKIKSLSRSLHDEKKALADMRAQADAAGGAHGVLAQQIRQSERRVEQLRNSLRTAARAQADNVVQATRQSGSLSRLRAEYRGLASEIDRTRRHQERLSRIMAAQERERAHRSNLMGRGLATAAAAGTLAVPVKMAISAEDTFADLKKVLPDMTDEAVEQIFQDALALSAKTGKSFEDVVAIMTAGAQAGLGKTREEMLAVTEQSLQMAVAWGVGADEAGKSLATWQASMKLTSAESKCLADTINVLSDNMNAEAGEINRIVTRMGPLLKEIGFSTSGIAAYGAAFKAAGADVEVCGTALKNMTKVMSAGSAGLTKERRGIYAQLRIDPDTLAKQMQQDAEGATLMVLEALKRVAPEERMGLATRLFGDESIGAIAPLLGNIDLLKDALVTAQGEVDGSVWKEYQNRMSTTASAGNRLLAKIRGLSIETGKRLLPATKKTFDALGRGVDVIRGLARDYPRLTNAVIIGTAALVALSVAGLAGSYVFSGLKSAWLAGQWALAGLAGTQIRAAAAQRAHTLASLTWGDVMRGGRTRMSGLIGALSAFTGIQRGATLGTVLFTTASKICGIASGILSGGIRAVGLAFKFAFGPVGLLIAGLAMGVGLIIDNWDKVGPYFQAAWDNITGIFAAAWEFIKGIWAKITGAVESISKAVDDIPVVGSAKRGLGAAWDWAFGDDEEEEKKPAPSAPAAEEVRGLAAPSASSSAPSMPAAALSRASSAGASLERLPDYGDVMAGMTLSGGSGAPEVTVPMAFQVQGLDMKVFRQKIGECRGDFESIVRRVVADMQHQQARVSYGG